MSEGLPPSKVNVAHHIETSYCCNNTCNALSSIHSPNSNSYSLSLLKTCGCYYILTNDVDICFCLYLVYDTLLPCGDVEGSRVRIKFDRTRRDPCKPCDSYRLSHNARNCSVILNNLYQKTRSLDGFNS